MSVLGNAAEWQVALIPIQDIVRDTLLPEAWPLCCSECAGADLREDVVTDRLVKYLRIVKSKRRSDFENIKFEIYPQTGVNPDGDQPGRTDILVSPCLGEEEVNLVYECKWLEKRKDCVSSYVGSDGIGRFLSGKYSAKVNVGQMVGYVHKAPLPTAAQNVIVEMQKQAMSIPVIGATPPPNTCVMNSTHTRQNGLDPIDITHILLPYI